jgi:hypothetical protein
MTLPSLGGHWPRFEGGIFIASLRPRFRKELIWGVEVEASSCISFACRWLGPGLVLVVDWRGWSVWTAGSSPGAIPAGTESWWGDVVVSVTLNFEVQKSGSSPLLSLEVETLEPYIYIYICVCVCMCVCVFMNIRWLNLLMGKHIYTD